MEQANAYPQQVQQWLAKVEVGEGLHHENLTVFPLFWHGDEEVPADSGEAGVEPGSKARYQLLSDAVEAKEALVEEVSPSVPM